MEKQMREWLEDRVAYIRGLKSPNDHQRLLLLLNDKKDATDDDRRKLVALIRAEKAAEKAQRAKASVAKIVNAEKEAERKRRNHELYESGGLLILAGLVDTKTGKPTLDRGELLGALLGLAKVPADDARRSDWKRAGDALLAERERK
ncbi:MULTISPECIES: conjugal transfer protein TraD [Pseudomonas]|nr:MULTISPECIES: conjugal transfer protein TraD [Pseudomonas]